MTTTKTKTNKAQARKTIDRMIKTLKEINKKTNNKTKLKIRERVASRLRKMMVGNCEDRMESDIEYVLCVYGDGELYWNVRSGSWYWPEAEQLLEVTGYWDWDVEPGATRADTADYRWEIEEEQYHKAAEALANIRVGFFDDEVSE